jgi:WD40 repeat protein
MFRTAFSPFTVVLVISLLCFAPARSADAVGWDGDDILMTGYGFTGDTSKSNRIAVYDSDFTFKGLLDPSFNFGSGLDFDGAGRLVAASQGGQVRVYDSTGATVGGFANAALGAAADLKVAPDGTYVVGTQNLFGGDGVRRFNADGSLNRQYFTGDYSSVAVVPQQGRFWAGGLGAAIEVFDLATHAHVGTIPLASPSQRASTMYFSDATDTVLVGDSGGQAVYELDLSGALVRTFTASGADNISGVTRGPNGDVFATSSLESRVYRWTAAGVVRPSVFTASDFTYGAGIAWAGNVVPEPSAGLIVCGGAAVLALWRRPRPSNPRS